MDAQDNPQDKPDKHDPGNPRRYIGRFAPSPTGPLHFGSLLAAIGSFLQARANDGAWLVRIEDMDPPREVPGAAKSQLETLARFGMFSDQPVVYQSRSSALHLSAVARLRGRGLAFDCACSRRDLPPSGIYPGTCRDGIASGKTARSVRFRVPETSIEMVDRVFGPLSYPLRETCGDFVIRRADGLFAYQLAVVVDDIAAGATEIVRGSDLLDSSPRQQAILKPWMRRCRAGCTFRWSSTKAATSSRNPPGPIRRSMHGRRARLLWRSKRWATVRRRDCARLNHSGPGRSATGRRSEFPSMHSKYEAPKPGVSNTWGQWRDRGDILEAAS